MEGEIVYFLSSNKQGNKRKCVLKFDSLNRDPDPNFEYGSKSDSGVKFYADPDGSETLARISSNPV